MASLYGKRALEIRMEHLGPTTLDRHNIKGLNERLRWLQEELAFHPKDAEKIKELIDETEESLAALRREIAEDKRMREQQYQRDETAAKLRHMLSKPVSDVVKRSRAAAKSRSKSKGGARRPYRSVRATRKK
jgi:hypothetical protein